MGFTNKDLRRNIGCLLLEIPSEDKSLLRRSQAYSGMYPNLSAFLRGSIRLIHFDIFWNHLNAMMLHIIMDDKAYTIQGFLTLTRTGQVSISQDFRESFGVRTVQNELTKLPDRRSEISWPVFCLRTNMSKDILKFFLREVIFVIGLQIKKCSSPVEICFSVGSFKADHQVISFVSAMATKENRKHISRVAEEVNVGRRIKGPNNLCSLQRAFKEAGHKLNTSVRNVFIKSREIDSYDKKQREIAERIERERWLERKRLKSAHKEQISRKLIEQDNEKREQYKAGVQVEQVKLPISFVSFRGNKKIKSDCRYVMPYPMNLQATTQGEIEKSRARYFRDLSLQVKTKSDTAIAVRERVVIDEKKNFALEMVNFSDKLERLRKKNAKERTDLLRTWKNQMILKEQSLFLKDCKDGKISSRRIAAYLDSQGVPFHSA